MKRSPDASRGAAQPRPTAAPPRRAADAPDLRLVGTDPVTILAAVAAHGGFDTLVRALHVAGLAERLDGAGPFTLFAPTDRAFARLPEGVLDALLADPDRLRRVLSGHLLAAPVRAPKLGAPTTATAVDGTEVNVTVHGGTFRVNGARVVRPHLRAANGLVRAVDTVLLRH